MPNRRWLYLRFDISCLCKRGPQRTYHHHGRNLRTRECPHGVTCESPGRDGTGPRTERIRTYQTSSLPPYLSFKKFTYSIVGFHGTGSITYREALAAVFMEGYVDTVANPPKNYVPS